MRHATRLLSACLVGLSSGGCVEDRVYAGYYGEPESKEQAIMGDPPSTLGSGGASPPRAAGGEGGTSGGVAAPVAGMLAGEPTGGVAGAAMVQGGMAAAMPEPSDGACDLTGRWLATVHTATDALGQIQTIHTYVYYEIERQGDGYAITKGLQCGGDGVAEGLFAVNADFSRSWAGTRSRVSYAGRPVSSTQTASGCDVRFGKWYVVQGATYPHYTDPNIPMPTLEQPASGGMPGWEDWDEDGQPGITGYISGIVTGKVFVAPRVWTELGGVVASTADLMKLPVKWDQQYNMLSYDGTELLTSEAVRAADPSLHFAELARLTDSQAVGDDAAICAAVIDLAKTLTPTAAGL
jgi:hypothetical protein